MNMPQLVLDCHRTVLDFPDEDTPRYVYADALDETAGDVGPFGDSFRLEAELVRTMLAANIAACDRCRADAAGQVWVYPENGSQGRYSCYSGSGDKCGASGMRRRAIALLNTKVPCGYVTAERPLTGGASVLTVTTTVLKVGTLREWVTRDMPPATYHRVSLSRGFVDGVEITPVPLSGEDHGVKFLADLFRSCPLLICKVRWMRPVYGSIHTDTNTPDLNTGCHPNSYHRPDNSLTGYYTPPWHTWFVPYDLHEIIRGVQDAHGSADRLDCWLWYYWGMFLYGRKLAGLRPQNPQLIARLRREDLIPVLRTAEQHGWAGLTEPTGPDTDEPT